MPKDHCQTPSTEWPDLFDLIGKWHRKSKRPRTTQGFNGAAA